MRIISLRNLILESSLEDMEITYTDNNNQQRTIKVKSVISAGSDHPAYPQYLALKAKYPNSSSGPTPPTQQQAAPSTQQQAARSLGSRERLIGKKKTASYVPELSPPEQNKLNRELLSTTIFDNWNDENNLNYGKPPEDAPKVSAYAFKDGALIDKPIKGVYQDIHIGAPDYHWIDDATRVGKGLASTSQTHDYVTSDVFEKIEDFFWTTPISEAASLTGILRSWMGGNTNSGLDTLVDQMTSVTGGKVRLDVPILRGVNIRSQDLDGFMENFEIGNTIGFDEFVSFSDDGQIAGRFSAHRYGEGYLDKEVSQVSVIMRIHPTSEGTHSGVYLPDVHHALESIADNRQAEDAEEEKDMKYIRDTLEESKVFVTEREFIPSQNARYRILGRVRITGENSIPDLNGVDMSDNREAFVGGNKFIIVDMEEVSEQTSEANLPGSPELPSPVKKLNKIAMKYLTQPMNPEKGKSKK
jgi:hypothetical protein